MSKEEIWKDVKGYEGLYQCSNLGRIKSLDREITVTRKNTFTKLLKGGIRTQQNRTGYKAITLFKDGKRATYYVHRLVAETFIPNPMNLPMVNHIDEIRTNNCVFNLEWCTHQENLTHGTANERKNRKLSTPIIGIHISTGKKITFPSMMEAGRNGFHQSEISLCCNGKKDQHKNYKWNFKTERGD